MLLISNNVDQFIRDHNYLAHGYTFEEALQKALRMVDTGRPRFEAQDIERILREPTPERIQAITGQR